MRTSETRKIAKKIVQYCLSWADKGRFEGKGDARKLLFPSIVNRRTGDIVQVEERMIDDVATMLEEEINPCEPVTRRSASWSG